MLVRLWEVETGKCLQVLEGHLGQVYSVCFAPNGKYLVAAGAAGRLQFWDFEKGETFLYRYAFGPIPHGGIDLLPDGPALRDQFVIDFLKEDRFDASLKGPETGSFFCIFY